MFSKFFNISLFHYLAGNTVNFEEKKIINFQNLIKNSSVIKDIFKQFIKDLNFDLEDTFCDKITIRFSPSQNEKPLGLLKPAMPHRDTWASGFQHQINWWIPLHDVSRENSLYFLPKYFSKEVKNNSDKWNFQTFKKNKKIMSTPVSTQKFFSNDYLYSQIRTENY